MAATRSFLSLSGLDRKGRGTGTGQRESDTGGSARAISAARLNVSPRSHLRPIDVVVYHGPQRRPHLGAGFRLDAFSAYPIRTRLPGRAPGGATGSP